MPIIQHDSRGCIWTVPDAVVRSSSSIRYRFILSPPSIGASGRIDVRDRSLSGGDEPAILRRNDAIRLFARFVDQSCGIAALLQKFHLQVSTQPPRLSIDVRDKTISLLR